MSSGSNKYSSKRLNYFLTRHAGQYNMSGEGGYMGKGDEDEGTG